MNTSSTCLKVRRPVESSVERKGRGNPSAADGNGRGEGEGQWVELRIWEERRGGECDEKTFYI